MNSVAADVKYAFRLFRKSPGFAAVAVGTLALGIGANTVIFSGVEAFLLRPLPVPEADRIVFMRQMLRRTGALYGVAYPDLLDWKSGASALQHVAGVGIDTFNLTGDGEPERVRGSRVTADFFSVFGVPPAAGRVFSASEDQPGAPPVVLISEALAQRRFGGLDAVGKPLHLDGRTHMIVGVMSQRMRFPMGFCDLWVPLATNTALSGRGNHFLAAVGKLAPGATLAQAEKQLDGVSRQIEAAYPESNKDMTVRIVPLARQISSGPRQAILVLWTAVAFVLLICCANLANLTLARSIHRTREFAVRQAVGASRWRVLRQVLVESTTLALTGGAAGLALATWGIDLLSANLPAVLVPMGGFTLNARVLLFTVGLSLATGMFFGLLPAVRTLRSQAADALREGGRAMAGGRVRNRMASALVVGEVTLAVTLLGGAGLLLQALVRMQGTDMGIEPRNVLTAEIAPKSEKYRDPVQQSLAVTNLLSRLGAAPGVVAAAAVNFPPMTNNRSRAYAVDGHSALDGTRPPVADYRVATPDYAAAMGLTVIRGRFISGEDRFNASPVVVVNQRFAEREWPGQNPIGRQVSLYTAPGKLGPWRSVAGVIGNVRHAGPGADPNAEIYVPFEQESQSSLYLVVRTKGDPAAFASSMRSIVRSADADLPLALVRPMERVIADGLAPARLTTGLLAILSAAALLLAAMGLYGVISYLVARRTHEFGVRIAMGATSARLLRLVLRRSLVLTGSGTLLGLLAAWGVSRVLASLIGGVRPDVFVFAGVAAVLAGVATLAAWVPLRRALTAGPLNALRSE
jgi:putative ABC transport system permease protein